MSSILSKVWALQVRRLAACFGTSRPFGKTRARRNIDNNGIINLYTFGQYGQKGTGIFGLYNTGSALVHLKGADANAYLKHEFLEYPISVYEISASKVNKEKIIEYYSNEMRKYNIPAEKIENHAPVFVNENNGSSAVRYKPYWVTPTGENNENCSSVVGDGLEAGGLNFCVPAVPWLYNETLWEYSNQWDKTNYKDVRIDAIKGALDNRNSGKNLKKEKQFIKKDEKKRN